MADTDPTEAAPAEAPTVSPEMKAAAILRLEAAGQLNKDQQGALDRLRKTGSFPTVNVAPDDPTFDAAETKYGLPHGLLHGIHAVESGGKGNAEATSPTGVKGLMQVTLGTGAKYGLTAENRSNPYLNIDIAARHLHDLLGETGGDVPKALQRYKGHGTVDASDEAYIRGVTGVMRQRAQIGQGIEAARTAAPLESAPTALPQGAPSPAPQVPEQAAQPAEEGDPTPPTIVRNPLSTLAFKGIVDAADLNAVLNKHGLSPFPPEALRDFLLSHPNIAGENITTLIHQNMEKAAPHAADSGLMQAFQAAAPLEFLAQVPALAGAVTLAASGDLDKADAVEAVVGGVQAVRGTLGMATKGYKLYQSIKEARALATTTAFDAADAAAARRAATMKVLSTKRMVTGAEELQSMMQPPKGIQAAEAPERAGEALTAIGRHRTELVEGEDVGLRAAQSRASTVRKGKFSTATTTADNLNMTLDPMHAGPMGVAHGANELLDQYGVTGLNPDERELLGQMQRFGATMSPTGDVAIHPQPMTGEGARPGTPLSSAMDLYAAARAALGDPRKFPVLARPAKNAFNRLTLQLGDVIRAEAQTEPAVAHHWENATRFVLEQEKPLQATVRTFGSAKATGPKAVRGILLGKDPTHIERLFQWTGPAERQLYQTGSFYQLVHDSTDASGTINAQNLLKSWNKLPDRTRHLIAAGADPRSEAALNTVVSGAKKFRDVGDTLKVGADRVTETLKQMAKAQSRGLLEGHPLVKAARVGVSGFAAYHLIRGAMMLGTGNKSFAAYHLFTALIMSRPGLAMGILRSNPDTVQGRQIAGAVEAAVKGMTALRHGQDDQVNQEQAPAQ